MTIQSKLVGLCGAITLLFFGGFSAVAAAQPDRAPLNINESDMAAAIETLLADMNPTAYGATRPRRRASAESCQHSGQMSPRTIRPKHCVKPVLCL